METISNIIVNTAAGERHLGMRGTFRRYKFVAIRQLIHRVSYTYQRWSTGRSRYELESIIIFCRIFLKNVINK